MSAMQIDKEEKDLCLIVNGWLELALGLTIVVKSFGTLYKLEDVYVEEDNDSHVNSAIKMMICCACSFHWYHSYL